MVDGLGFYPWKNHLSKSKCRRHSYHNNRTCLTCFFFFSAFTVAFLFNWIGFFLSFCLTTSAAGRYGAISGFGLSLIKWILIVRVSCIPEKIDPLRNKKWNKFEYLIFFFMCCCLALSLHLK